MARILSSCVLVICFQIAAFTDPPCVIELECAECLPDNMPLVTSHRAANGSVRVPHGDEALLSCGGGHFLAFPLRATLDVVCEGGRYRLRHDHSLRHLLDLGCQESVLEDVMHQVDHCAPPLQGRAYQVQAANGRVRHVATLCWDADKGHATRAQAGQLHLSPHTDARAPLSLLGNFNHMFDARTRLAAERLYSDTGRSDRCLRELFKHDRFSFAGQTLAAAELLARQYFEDQEMRAAEFVSNKVPVWKSVADGNLKHVHTDVARFLRRAPSLEVHAGTHGVLSLRTGPKRSEVYLKAGGRFPVPKYVWTAVVDRSHRTGIALVLLNDPFVAVSEIRDAVFCESSCGRASWLHELHRHRNYEVPLYGLVFCCGLHNFTDTVPELPKDIVRDIKLGENGLLTDLTV